LLTKGKVQPKAEISSYSSSFQTSGNLGSNLNKEPSGDYDLTDPEILLGDSGI